MQLETGQGNKQRYKGERKMGDSETEKERKQYYYIYIQEERRAAGI